MTESIDVVPSPRSRAGIPRSGFSFGEIATLTCDRCKKPQLPWELRPFGEKSICPVCYDATLELARGAIGAMPADEPGRLCANCRALRDPSLGSAWCKITDLGDERARICANFVPVQLEMARTHLTGGRTGVIDIWTSVSEILRSTLGEKNYQTWFGGIEPLDLQGNDLVLAVPDEFTREWLEKRLEPVVQKALITAGHGNVTPRYVVETEVEHSPPDPDAELRARLNSHYTFSEFIVGSGNRLAHASAVACVENPAKVYNPLVIYGGVGIGKTHLLQAIGHEALDRQRGRVLYVTSEAFTNELIQGIREGTTNEFRERYRSVDFLLIDDVQFIAGKEATQEEFFHTFNALHSTGKQIVVTCDRPPSELRVLEDRLRSRFAWGLTVDIQPPDLETRMAIVHAKAAQRGRRLPEAVLNALANRAARNVRELEGALNRVLALADLLGVEPGIEVVRSILGEEEDVRRTCSPADVLQAVSAYFRIKGSELVSQQRDRRVAYARQMAMYLLREESKLSLVAVGNQLGGRNHSTVIYSIDKIAESKGRGRVRQDLQALRQLIYGAR